jgi:hypothetical protein
MKSPAKAQWEEAMLLELASHEANHSFEPAILPPGKKPLGMRWVFKVKYDDSATEATRRIARYKARLVIQGYTQVQGVDFEESYSPVIAKEILRLMLTIGAVLDYEIDAMDVITAFLNGVIDCEVYVKHPPGFDTSKNPRDVLRVLRSVYGLKQSPRLWYQTLVTYLQQQGYTQLIKDRCVFTKLIQSRPVYIGVYVDDIVIMAPTRDMIATIKDGLSARFKMHDLGPLTFILGFHILRDRTQRTLTMHQSQYATSILKRFSMENSKPVGTPMECNLKLSESMCPQNDAEREFMKQHSYRSVVGSIMYLMISTRPDLAYVVQQLSQFLTNPGPGHWQAAKRALRYIRGTIDYGLVLGGAFDHTTPLHAYADSDYANCVDTRRCVAGFVTFYSNSAISWVAKRLRSIVLSTTEAELMILCSVAQECLYIKQAVGEMGRPITTAIPLHEDNQSTIQIVNNSGHHGRTKHIDVRYHFINDLVEQQVFRLVYTDTRSQVADIFTKPLDILTFCALRSKLRVEKLQPSDTRTNLGLLSRDSGHEMRETSQL